MCSSQIKNMNGNDIKCTGSLPSNINLQKENDIILPSSYHTMTSRSIETCAVYPVKYQYHSLGTPRSCTRSEDTITISRNADSSMKHKLNDFFSGLSTGNVTIVRKVEKMVHEQRGEIELLTTRINVLNQQIDRQKDYYRKREDIIKEMYEEELSLLENAHQSCSASEHCEVVEYKRKTTPIEESAGVAIGEPTACKVKDLTKSVDNIHVDKCDASTSTEGNILDPRASASHASTSPIKFKQVDVSCATQDVKSKMMVAKALQCDRISPPQVKSTGDKTMSEDDQACAKDSPLKPVGDRLSEQLNKELEEDAAFKEVEKLHEKTQYLYRKLNIVLKELNENTGRICSVDVDKKESNIKFDSTRKKLIDSIDKELKRFPKARDNHIKSIALKTEEKYEGVKSDNLPKDLSAAGDNPAAESREDRDPVKATSRMSNRSINNNNRLDPRHEKQHDTCSNIDTTSDSTVSSEITVNQYASDGNIGQTVFHKPLSTKVLAALNKSSGNIPDDRTVNSDVSTIPTLDVWR